MPHLPSFLRRALLACLLLPAALTLPAAPTEIELILDASGSMWNKLEDGRYRIDAAKQVLTEFIAQTPNDPNLRIGLRIYGARVHYSKPGACEDSVLVAPIAPLDRPRLLKEVRETRAVGATPLAYSIGLAAQDFRESGRKQVIVCTDGEESCGGDVAAAVKTLRDLGADVDVRFIGIGLPPAAAVRLGKIAPIENVNSARRLAEALQTATRATVQAAPAAKPGPAAPKVGTVVVRVVRDGKPLAGPEVGVAFKADLSDAAPVELRASGSDFTGALPGGSYTATVRPGGRQFAALGVSVGDKTTFTFDLTEAPKVTVTPEKTSVLAGTTLKASFRGAKGVENQYLVFAPVGSPDREETSFVLVEGASGSAELTVPPGAGEFEIRFTSLIGSGGEYTVSGRSGPIKVLPVSATLDAPASITAATTMTIRWQGPNRTADWVGIIKKGGGVGDYISYAYAEPGLTEAQVETPEAGEYEVVYANDYAREVIARRPLKVVPLVIELTAPASAMAGADVAITWTGTAGRGHFLTIVKPTAAPNDYNDYAMLDQDHTVVLSAPEEAGDYEVRYASDHTRTVLARRPLKLTPPSATIEAPASAAVDAKFPVKAGGRLAKGDQIQLHPAGAAPEADAVDYHPIQNGPAGELSASKAGSYELRYVSKTAKILVRRPITIR